MSSSRAISKYTIAGLAARAKAIINEEPIVIKSFKISDVPIDLTGDLLVTDIENPWIEKNITSRRFLSVDDAQIAELQLSVLMDEAVKHGRSMAIYLEDGTPYIVSTPPNDYNPNLEQRYLVQITMVNADFDSYDFKYIPNKDLTVQHHIYEYNQEDSTEEIVGVVVKFGEIDNSYLKENTTVSDY
jgi:hypothetical protein